MIFERILKSYELNKEWWDLTWLQRFDCNRCRVVPDPFPHFAKLSATQFPFESQAGPLNLPLVSGGVGQVSWQGFLNLQEEEDERGELGS